MSVQEIEQAIMSLKTDEVDQLAKWLADFRTKAHGGSILDLAGTISLDDLKLMSAAIEEGCERIDMSDW